MSGYHPFFVHFPIALLLVAVLFDLYAVIKKHSFSRVTAYSLQLMSAISALLAAITGHQAETVIMGQEKLAVAVSDALTLHTSMGNAAVWIIVLIAMARTFALLEKKSWALSGWFFPCLSVGLGLLVLVTGLLGGRLSEEILHYFVNF